MLFLTNLRSKHTILTQRKKAVGNYLLRIKIPQVTQITNKRYLCSYPSIRTLFKNHTTLQNVTNKTV